VVVVVVVVVVVLVVVVVVVVDSTVRRELYLSFLKVQKISDYTHLDNSEYTTTYIWHGTGVAQSV